MNRAIVLLLVSLVASGEALKCYQCNGCEEGQRGNPVNCDSTAGSCAVRILYTLEVRCAMFTII